MVENVDRDHGVGGGVRNGKGVDITAHGRSVQARCSNHRRCLIDAGHLQRTACRSDGERPVTATHVEHPHGACPDEELHTIQACRSAPDAPYAAVSRIPSR